MSIISHVLLDLLTEQTQRRLLHRQSFFTDEDVKMFSVQAVAGPAEATLLQLELADVFNSLITLLDFILCPCESVELF